MPSMLLNSIALLCFISSGAVGLPSATKANDSVVQRDPSDHGYKIHNAFALGDSYTANPGAGKEKDDSRARFCHLFTQSWPYQLEDNNMLKGFNGNAADVRNFACSGAVLKEIENQAHFLDKDTPVEMIMLTGGGNDLGFSNILKICLFGVTFNGGEQKCNKALNDAHQLIDSMGFGERIGNALSAFRSKKPNAYIYWLGYPRLFSEDPNDNCDTKCFRVKIAGLPDPRCPKWRQLSVENRRKYNSLVDALNGIVSAVINAQPAGPAKIYYVDVDAGFRGHRFCSASTRNVNDANKDIYFYPLSREDVDFRAEDFDGFDTSICYDDDALETLDVDTQFDCAVWRDNHSSGNSTQQVTSTVAAKDKISLQDAKLRAFHPTIMGAAVYAEVLAEKYLGNDDDD